MNSLPHTHQPSEKERNDQASILDYGSIQAQYQAAFDAQPPAALLKSVSLMDGGTQDLARAMQTAVQVGNPLDFKQFASQFFEHLADSPKGSELTSREAMTKTQVQSAKRAVMWVITFFLALVLLGGAWMLRWQAVEFHTGGAAPAAALLINRLTGEMRYVQGIEWIAVQETKR